MLKATPSVYKIDCPACQKPIRVPESMLGQQAKCPGCDVLIQIPEGPSSLSLPKQDLPVAKPLSDPANGGAAVPAKTPPTAKALPTNNMPPTAKALPTRPTPKASPTHQTPKESPTTGTFVPVRKAKTSAARTSTQPKSNTSRILGIVALLLGVVSCAIFWLPFIGPTVGGIGLLLGFIALGLTIAKKGTGFGFAIAGTAISGIGLFLGIVVSVAVLGMAHEIENAVAEMEREQSAQGDLAAPSAAASASPAPSSSATPTPPVTNNSKTEAKARSQAQSSPAVESPSEPPADVSTKFHAPTEALRVGRVQLEITDVRIGRVPIYRTVAKKDSASVKELLSVWVKVKNISPDTKVEYYGWMSDHAANNRYPAKMTDSFGTKRSVIYFRSTSVMKNTTTSGTIEPGEFFRDAICFELPSEGAEHLDLILSTKCWGTNGEMRFRIPTSMIQRSTAP